MYLFKNGLFVKIYTEKGILESIYIESYLVYFSTQA